MNKSALLVIGMSLALLAGALTWLMQSRVETEAIGQGSRQLVVASRDVPSGAVLAESDLTTEDAPVEAESRGSLRVPSAAIGRITVAPLRKGQMIVESDLVPRGSAAAILAQLPPGSRAITVLLRDPSAAVALFPGASVDVIATIEGPAPGTSRSEAMSRVVVERSRVLAVNGSTGGEASAGDKDSRATTRRLSVTLAVTPEQAAQIELASARGTIGLALCSASDPSAPSSNAVSTTKLLGLPETTVAKQTERPAQTFAETSAPNQAASGTPVVKSADAGAGNSTTDPRKAEPKPAAPKPTVWEVTVIRGDKAERLEFERPVDAAKP